MRDYKEKKVYLGIDVHKKTYSVTAIFDGQVVKKDTLPADPQNLVNYCKKYFIGASIESAYEAGFSGFYLHHYLQEHGIQNHVIHAAGIEIAIGDKVKTDKRDSLKIATQLSVGRLKSIHIPSQDRELKRALSRIRTTFIRHLSRVGCQLKSLLFLYGLVSPGVDIRVSRKWINNVKKLEMPEELKSVVQHYIDYWEGLKKKIQEIDCQLRAQSQKDGAIEEVYRSTPGIGPVTARVLANELGDMSQFKNERQLFSFIGLTPSQYSSGEHVRLGHITRQGRPIIRNLLIQAAWVTIKYDSELKEIYERLASKKGGKKAIVAIGRHLIGRIRACFRTGQLYGSNKKVNVLTGEMQTV